MRCQSEHRFIQKLSQDIIQIVNRNFGKPRTVASKSSAGDLVTDIDKRLDRLIAKRISQSFPNDCIVSEESSGPNVPERGRVWVIDPICGTSNLAHGIRFFATNIALVEDGRVVTAWVIDHAQQRLIFTLGNGLVQSGGKRAPKLTGNTSPIMLDVNWGYWHPVPPLIQKRYIRFASSLLFKYNNIWMHSFNTSLSFTYIATGQLDAAVVINVYPWDLLAPCFLIEQNDGIVTNFNGSPYTVRSKSVVMARNKHIHQFLLNLLAKHSLHTVC